jgi:phage host-nuclease inhibitor protein Gam
MRTQVKYSITDSGDVVRTERPMTADEVAAIEAEDAKRQAELEARPKSLERRVADIEAWIAGQERR